MAALIGAFGTPFIINRFGGPLPAFLVNGALWATMPLGLLFAPDLWALWSALAGIAQGGGFVVIFTVVVMRAADAAGEPAAFLDRADRRLLGRVSRAGHRRRPA